MKAKECVKDSLGAYRNISSANILDVSERYIDRWVLCKVCNKSISDFPEIMNISEDGRIVGFTCKECADNAN